MQGPNLTGTLVSVLMRFRHKPIVFMVAFKQCFIKYVCLKKIEICFDSFGGL